MSSNAVTTKIADGPPPLLTEQGQSFKYNEDGRRYHGREDIDYILPNDDDEADRVHEQHWILKYIFQRNYFAPVTDKLEQGITVLDSGTGPATWPFEMSRAFPNSKFIGVDVSGVFPQQIKPANVEFAIGNIAKNIPFPDNHFDYIHQRFLIAGLTNDGWNSNLKELYRVLKPGGYLEIKEFDIYNIVNIGPVWEILRKGSAAMFRSRDIPMEICKDLEQRIKNTGFINQQVIINDLAVNHGGKAGRLFWGDIKIGSMNLKPVMAKVNPEWEDIKEFEKYIDATGAEANERKCAMKHYTFIAQKPLE